MSTTLTGEPQPKANGNATHSERRRQGWDMTQAVSSCGGGGSDTTLDNAHVVEDYLARTTTMYHRP